MKRKILLLALLAVLVLSAGCISDGEIHLEDEEEQQVDAQDVPQSKQDVRVLDYPDREVVCFVYREAMDTNSAGVGGTGGISCLPYEEVEGYE